MKLLKVWALFTLSFLVFSNIISPSFCSQTHVTESHVSTEHHEHEDHSSTDDNDCPEHKIHCCSHVVYIQPESSLSFIISLNSIYKDNFIISKSQTDFDGPFQPPRS